MFTGEEAKKTQRPLLDCSVPTEVHWKPAPAERCQPLDPQSILVNFRTDTTMTNAVSPSGQYINRAADWCSIHAFSLVQWGVQDLYTTSQTHPSGHDIYQLRRLKLTITAQETQQTQLCRPELCRLHASPLFFFKHINVRLLYRKDRWFVLQPFNLLPRGFRSFSHLSSREENISHADQVNNVQPNHPQDWLIDMWLRLLT